MKSSHDVPGPPLLETVSGPGWGFEKRIPAWRLSQIFIVKLNMDASYFSIIFNQYLTHFLEK